MSAPKDPEKYKQWRAKLKAAAKRRGGHPHTEASKQAISRANKKYFSDEKVRMELSERTTQQWANEESRAVLMDSLGSESSRSKKSIASREAWKRPDYAENMVLKSSERMKARWADPEASAVLRAANASEESRSKKSKAHKERWADPEIGPKQLTRLLSYCTDHTRYKRGWHFSPKTGDLHRFRSSYELRAYQLLDADPNVALYLTEPCVIPYTFDGRQRRYVVDLYVEFQDGSWQLIEIKPAYALAHPTVQAKLAAANRIYTSEHFACWTEEHLQ